MISKSSNNYIKLKKFIKQYNNKIKLFLLLDSSILLINSILFVSICLWLFSVIFTYFNSYFIENSILFVISTLSIVILLTNKKFISKITNNNLVSTAKEIENVKSFSGRLISSADFILKNYKHDKSLEQEYVNETYNIVSSTKIPFPKINKTKKKLYISALLFMIFILFSLIFKYSPYKYIKETFFSSPPVISYKLNYPKEIEKGKNFKLTILSSVEKVYIEAGLSKNKLKDISIEKIQNSRTNQNTWTLLKSNIERDFYFKVFFREGKHVVSTDIKKITVFTYPNIKSMKLTYIPPSVYKLPVKIFKDNGNIEGFIGSRVKLKIEYTNKLKNAKIFFLKSKKTYKMKVNGNFAEFTFTITRKEDYKIHVKDIFNHANAAPPIFSVIPLIDKKPKLNIIYPARDIVSRNTEAFKLKISAEDDYGLRNIKVIIHKYVNKNANKPLFKNKLTFNLNSTLQLNKTFNIPITDLTVNPGEIIKYRIYLKDTGNHVVKSKWYKISFPNMFQMLRQMDNTRENIAQNLEKILQEQRRLKREILEIKKKVQSGTASPEEIKKMKQLINKQRKLFNQMNQQLKRLENMTRNVQTNPQVLNKDLAKKLKEINKLLREVLSRDAREALNRMQEYLKKMQNNQNSRLSQSAQDMQKYIERLQRTIEMLRKLKSFQRLTNARAILREMKRRSKILKNLSNMLPLALSTRTNTTRAERTSNPENEQNRGRNSRQQNSVPNSQNRKKIKNQSNSIENARQNFSEQISRINLPQIRRSLKILKQLSDRNLKKFLSNIQNENNIANNVNNTEQTIKKMLDKINKLIKKVGGSNISKAKKFLERYIFELINFSKYLNSTLNELNVSSSNTRFTQSSSRNIFPKIILKNKASYVQFIQSKIKTRSEEFSKVFEGILRQKKPFLLVSAHLYKELGEIAYNFSETKVNLARVTLKRYMQNHNYYIYMLLNLQNQLNKAMNNQMGQGQGENLNSLAELQRKLNEQVKRMWGKARQGGLSAAQKKYLQKLAREQSELARKINKIANSGSETGKRLKKALEAIRREMEEVARHLQKQKLNRKLLNKQRRILKRMLDADMGLERNEREKKRRGELSNREDFGENAEIRKAFREYMKLQKIKNNKNFKNLSPYYQKLIKEYFNYLKNLLNN